jgi:hypothetical protein
MPWNMHCASVATMSWQLGSVLMYAERVRSEAVCLPT